MMRFLVVWMLLLAAPFAGWARVDVIVDTDAGSDDLMAIAYLLANNDVRIEAITVVHGLAHVPAGTSNLLKLLALSKRGRVPVYMGRDEPLLKTAKFPAEWRRTADALLADVAAPSQRAERLDAVDFLAKVRGKRLLALGPLTNIALALERGAKFSSITLMGGALRVPGNLGDGGYYRTSNKTAEWNLFCDAKAAAQVFASGTPLEMVPLDATNKAPIDVRFLEDLRTLAGSPLAKAVHQLLDRDSDIIRQGIYFAWDPLAAVAMIHPEVVRWADVRVRVEPDGTTREIKDGGGGTAAKAAIDAEPAQFRNLYLEAMR